MPLSPVIEKAIELCIEGHGDQYRKGTTIPYVSHLFSVAALVWEYGGTDDQVAAALLHDYVEDQGGPEAEARLRAEFPNNPDVTRIVLACSDAAPAPGEQKAPWKVRKQKYLEELQHEDANVLLVSAADKLHNLRTLVADYRQVGNEVWSRFNEKDPHSQLWYYSTIAETYAKADLGALSDEYARVVSELDGLVNS